MSDSIAGFAYVLETEYVLRFCQAEFHFLKDALQANNTTMERFASYVD
jgi:hypothetical protein